MHENISYGRRGKDYSIRYPSRNQRKRKSSKCESEDKIPAGSPGHVRPYLLTRFSKKKTPELKSVSKHAFLQMRSSLVSMIKINHIKTSEPPKTLSPNFLKFTDELFSDIFGMFSRTWLVLEDGHLYLDANIATTLFEESFPTLRLGGLEKMTGDIRQVTETAIGELLAHNKLLTSAHETVWAAIMESLQADNFEANNEEGQEFIDSNIKNIKAILSELDGIASLTARLKVMQRTDREILKKMLEKCREIGQEKEKELADCLLENIDLLYNNVWNDNDTIDLNGYASVSISEYDHFPITLYEKDLTGFGYETAMAVFECDVDCAPLYIHNRINHDGTMENLEPEKHRFLLFIEKLSTALEKFL